MDVQKKVEELKNLFIKRDTKLFGFWAEDKALEYEIKVQKLVHFLTDGTGYSGKYLLKEGWLFVYGNDINQAKALKLGFKPYKNGYVKKVFQNKQFLFKIG